jgi:hypothetical protein
MAREELHLGLFGVGQSQSYSKDSTTFPPARLVAHDVTFIRRGHLLVGVAGAVEASGRVGMGHHGTSIGARLSAG